MILGYGIIAVPTGIVSVEYWPTPAARSPARRARRAAPKGTTPTRRHCKYCGAASDARPGPG